MNKSYKITLIKSLKFLIILILIDQLLGTVTRIYFFKQQSGKYYRISYSMDSAKADIFIFGSSHANRHYDVDVFEKELGMTCYNAGVQGQELLFVATLQKIILQRTKPKLIILNIDPEWLYESAGSYDKLGELNPYYFKNPDLIGQVLKKNKRFIEIPLLSKLYQYNSTIAHIVKYFFFPQDDNKGFRALTGVNDSNFKNQKSIELEEKNQKIDTLFVRSFKELLINAKNNKVEIIAVTSPSLFGVNLNRNFSFKEMESILLKQNVSLFNFCNDERFLNHNELYSDPGHLNIKGAALFSKFVADTINRKSGILQNVICLTK